VMCIGGAAAVRQVERGLPWRLNAVNVGVAAIGIAIVLYSFTVDSLHAMPDGLDAVAQARPSHFPWAVFLLGFAALSWAGLRVTWPTRSRLLRT
jgi:hypothetical protein